MDDSKDRDEERNKLVEAGTSKDLSSQILCPSRSPR